MENNKIILPETEGYYLQKDPQKGIAVIASKNFKEGDVISRNYIAVIDWEMDETSAFQQTYPLYWSEEFSCIAFGVINLVNHSFTPNCDVIVETDSRTLSLVCCRDISPEEELTIDYGDGHYPFKHGNVKIY